MPKVYIWQQFPDALQPLVIDHLDLNGKSKYIILPMLVSFTACDAIEYKHTSYKLVMQRQRYCNSIHTSIMYCIHDPILVVVC